MGMVGVAGTGSRGRAAKEIRFSADLNEKAIMFISSFLMFFLFFNEKLAKC